MKHSNGTEQSAGGCIINAGMMQYVKVRASVSIHGHLSYTCLRVQWCSIVAHILDVQYNSYNECARAECRFSYMNLKLHNLYW